MTDGGYWGNLGPPPALAPVRADLFAGELAGRRVILDAPDGHLADFRAVTELAPSSTWPSCSFELRVASDDTWHAWRLNGSGDFPPGSAVWPATMVYVEPTTVELRAATDVAAGAEAFLRQ